MPKRLDCLICTAPTKFTRLGAQVCRACAAFYKRTVTAERTFKCRAGDGQCTIRKHVNYICRSCRYDKCVELRMTYNVKTSKTEKKEKKAVDSAAVTSFVKYDVIDDSPSTSTSATSSEASKMTENSSLIDRMEVEYKASYNRRVAQEKEYALQRNLQPYKHNTEEFFIANFNAFYETFRIAIKDQTTIAKNVFEDFESLPIDHRVTLFKSFVSKLSVIECVYFTQKYCKNNDMFMASLITCADLNNMDQWTPPSEDASKNDALKATVRSFTDDYNDLLPMILMEEMTEREFYATAVLCYCDMDTSQHLPEEIVQSTQKLRKQVFEELQDYYRNELKLDDFSKRLGNLMTMVHGAGEAGILMIEEMRMYVTMFDVYSDDQFFREFFSE
ncbi:hypothetical protein PMAYCL1PPCAC_16578 [Pristionchus mayeri]|uniref:Nuclear receptor n=1 Tax=Pristionchus mayeri TaxID=1317129 RepID=A0AAN5CL15_9BILA|nr:hypothetical protein PMAYCL1PPCAC_16578 [Pristionchus mayeri]